MTDALLEILLVDDDDDTCANIRDILSLDGHRVVTVGSLGDAERLTRSREFDVAILDRRLPDGVADHFVPRLRRSAPRTELIVVTGYAELDSTIAAFRHGIADYILKPIHPDALRKSLDRIIRERDLQAELNREQRLAAIGKTMTALAHESRNALQRIQAGLEMLELELGENKNVQKDLGSIRRATSDLQRVLEEVRSFAAPIVLHFERANLAEIWRRVFRQLSNHHSDRQIELIDHGKECDYEMMVDVMRMEQIFRNLFQNSVDAGEDPVEIRIDCQTESCDGQHSEHRQIEPSRDRGTSAGTIRLILSDNGPGLNSSQREQLFEPFFTTKPTGTGLGMSIVQRIIEAHRGRISVLESDSGARLEITLPQNLPCE